MANIKKRGDTFQITVSLGYDSEGKRIRKTTTFAPTNVSEKKAQKLAEEFAFEFERKCRGQSALQENMRFSELIDWYFENYAPNKLKAITVYNYQSQLNTHVLPKMGHLKLKEFSPAKITELLRELNLSQATSRKLYVIIQSLFARACEAGFIRETPCRNVILPIDKVAKEKKPMIDEIQSKRLLQMLEGYSIFNTIIKLLLFTGLRSGEALGLRWEDIDFENRLIKVRHTLTDVSGRHWLTSPKTANAVRDIGMSEFVADLLKEHFKHQQELIEVVGDLNFLHPEMVFTSEIGNFKDRSALNTSFKRFLKGTEFEGILTLHSLRHANATLLLNSGVDLKVVSEHLGHSDVAITGNVYIDVLNDMKKRTADLISLKLT